MSVFGQPGSEGGARVHAAAEAGLLGGIAGLAGVAAIAGGGAIPAMLMYGAADLFGRVIPSIFKKSGDYSVGDWGMLDPIERLEAAAPTMASLEEQRARYPDFGTIIGIDGGKYDMYTGEQLDPPGTHHPDWNVSPQSAPAYEPAPMEREGEPVSWISTGLSSLGNIASGLASGVTNLVSGLSPLMDVATATAPLWGSAAPVAASFFGVPQTGPTSVPAGWVPSGEEGEEVYRMPYQTTSGAGGFQLAAGGLPGYDLMVPEAKIIEPRSVNGCGTRMPSTHVVPYKTASGRTAYATYKNMGRPVLYSGDFAAAKRVKRVASKARRRSGGR